MPLPPVPDELREPGPAEFVAAPATGPRQRLLVLGLVLAVASWLALARWDSAGVAVAGTFIAVAGGLAGVVAQGLCLRRDEAVALRLLSAGVEETDRGPLTIWRLAEPVPPRLARHEMPADWAAQAAAGEAVAARLQETGYGTLALHLGTVTGGAWSLPEARPAWPPLAQLGTAVAGLAVVAVVALAAAPSTRLQGHLVAAEQLPVETGTGVVPWQVTIALEPGTSGADGSVPGATEGPADTDGPVVADDQGEAARETGTAGGAGQSAAGQGKGVAAKGSSGSTGKGSSSRTGNDPAGDGSGAAKGSSGSIEKVAAGQSQGGAEKGSPGPAGEDTAGDGSGSGKGSAGDTGEDAADDGNDAAGEVPSRVVVLMSHERFLTLLEPRARRALAVPGLLPASQRDGLIARYLPVGRRVVLRRTRLGPWDTTFCVGPES